MHRDEAAHAADHIGQMRAIAHFDAETDHRDVLVAVQVFDRIDIGIRLGDGRRDLREYAGPVFHFHAQHHLEIAAHLTIPADRHPAFRRFAVLDDVGAIHPMHHDAAAGRVVAHHVVARDRHATVRERDHAALGAGDEDLLAVQRDTHREIQSVALVGYAMRQHLRDLRRHAVAQRDIGQQRLQPWITMVGQIGFQPRRRHAVQRCVHPFQRAVEHAMPQLHGILVFQLLELMADRRACFAGDHEFQPLRLGRRGFRGDHFHALTAGEFGAQRHQFLVDAHGDRMVADIGMHAIGEIEGRGVARQGHDVALRREQIHLVGKQIDLDVFQELQRRAGGPLRFDQVRHPRLRAVLRAAGFAAMFIGPVRGDAAFGDEVHFLGTNLHFDRRTVGPEQHRVQRLVTVGLGNRDEVAETAVDRLEHRMHHAQRVIALRYRRHDQPEAEHVHHLGEGLALGAHLRIDAPRRLHPADQAELEAFLAQPLRELRFDLGQRLAPHHRLGADAPRQHRMTPRVQRTEAQILQFGLHQIHAQPLRDRRVDLQRLAGDAGARLGALRAQRAHVVQTVGEFDQDHAQVARHRQHHLAETFRGGFLAILELQLVQLGDAFDQFGDGHAEIGRDRIARQRRVFDGVVEHRCDQGFDIDALLSQHRRGSHRMRDVGLAGFAHLAGVGIGTDAPGADQGRALILGQIVGRRLQRKDVIRQFRSGRRRGTGDDRLELTHAVRLRGNAGSGNGERGIAKRSRSGLRVAISPCPETKKPRRSGVS